jgi:hyperosmotically inducible periplasmic protein
MRNNFKRAMTSMLVLLGLVGAVTQGAWGKTGKQDQGRPGTARVWAPGEERIQREVLHQLRMLPYYSVFDNLSFKVQGNQVELMGQVARPTLKSDAEGVVKHIEGVERVVNNIEVLPLSGFDDRTRLAEYRAIYWHQGLDRYALQAIPPIHIIVKNGNVTLVGVVANMMDKNLAGIQANGVSGVFSVTNNLQVEK